MQVSSTYRYAKISPFKAREVTREIQGLPVSAALDLVAFSPKKAAMLISKTLKSAVANAENNANLRVDGLVVKEAIVGEGPTMKRMMPRARGSGSRILKRTSHIRIVLTDEIEVKKRENTKGQKKPGGKKSTKAKPASLASKQVAKETKVTEASKPPAKKKSGQMEE
jgi:large subunit ribosomal protein L22